MFTKNIKLQSNKRLISDEIVYFYLRVCILSEGLSKGVFQTLGESFRPLERFVYCLLFS